MNTIKKLESFGDGKQTNGSAGNLKGNSTTAVSKCKFISLSSFLPGLNLIQIYCIEGKITSSKQRKRSSDSDGDELKSEPQNLKHQMTMK